MRQGLRQGCVIASLLFNMFLTAVLRVTENNFITDAAIMDNTAQLQQKRKSDEKSASSTRKWTGGGGRRGRRRCRYCAVC